MRTTRDKVEVNMYMLADVSETQEETGVSAAAQPQRVSWGCSSTRRYANICVHYIYPRTGIRGGKGAIIDEQLTLVLQQGRHGYDHASRMDMTIIYNSLPVP